MFYSKDLRKVKAFTLVELLIVIAIISVLAGMLMPVVENAIEAARIIGCQNNFKQTSYSFHSYGNDYDGFVIPGQYAPLYDGLKWFEIINDYYLSNKEIFHCPTDPKFYFSVDEISYGYNVWHVGFHAITPVTSSYNHLFLKIDTLDTDTIVFADSYGFRPSYRRYKHQLGQWRGYIASRHNEGINTTFPDGHTEWISNLWGTNEYCRLGEMPFE